MIFENPAELKDRIESLVQRKVYGTPQVRDDTSDYMGLSAGTVVRLDGNDYYVTGEAKEGRFGIVEQPKFWVKYARDLTDGRRKIIKLVCHEQFLTDLGPFTVRCHRDPDKESSVLALVDGDDRFMQGITVRDSKNNNVRILEIIRGKSLYNHVLTLEQSHQEYFSRSMPGILEKLCGAIEAIGFLHDNDLQHGDVRNDHILIEIKTGKYRWIDFDYTVNFLDYDLWSIGNLLTYVAGKGITTCKDAIEMQKACGTSGTIEPQDALLFFKYRLANLRKVYPYIPKAFNDMLLRFSAGTTDFYESFPEITGDLQKVLGEF